MPSAHDSAADDRYPTRVASLLLDRLAAGDGRALEELFLTYYNSLCIYTERYVRSPHVAEELVSDVFLWIWENRASWRIEHGVKAYLYAAVRNRALRGLARDRVANAARARAKSEGRPIAMGEAPVAADEVAEGRDFERAVAQAIAALPPRCREAFLLHRQHGLSYAEIAEVMDTSVKTVENQLARAVKGLRTSLAAWSP